MMEYCLLPEGGRGAKLGGMVKEHVGSKLLLIFASRAPTLQCGVGDGGGRRDPCSSPSCGLGREGGQSPTAGLWGSPVVTPGCCMEILQSSKGAVP